MRVDRIVDLANGGIKYNHDKYIGEIIYTLTNAMESNAKYSEPSM